MLKSLLNQVPILKPVLGQVPKDVSGRQVFEHVLWHMSEHVPNYVPDRHDPKYLIKHVPKHAFKHISKKHVLEHEPGTWPSTCTSKLRMLSG